MIMPAGIKQETACMLIAFREFYDNPKWEHPYLLNNMRRNISGAFNGDFSVLCGQLNLWHDPFQLPPQDSNSDYVTLLCEDKRIRLQRRHKVICLYETTANNAHAVCCRATDFWAYTKAFKVLGLAFSRQGTILDRRSSCL